MFNQCKQGDRRGYIVDFGKKGLSMYQEAVKQTLPYKALKNMRMRLLDLTDRNRLINFRHTKKGSLRMIDELPNQLVETLLAENEMRFKAIPEPTEKELIEAGYLKFDKETEEVVRLRSDPGAAEWAKHLGLEISYEVPEQPAGDGSGKHSDKAIQTLLYPYEMEARLKTLLQASESAIQEMGANILYLAIGFLEWCESAGSDRPREAPLFLVPVRLHKGRLNQTTLIYEYTLSYTGEDIMPNLSLREKLRADFAMALPDLDENTAPEDYFKEMQIFIENTQPRWRVRRYISLALLNFSKLLMYLDLDPVRWPAGANILDHPVISGFLSGYARDGATEGDSPGDLGFGEEYLIDEMDEVHDNYPLIDDADSSQHSALIDAVNGKNLVIEGPPGTGKSQTITNLIAAAMAQGKKVLFVAEKLAALEVVRSRLGMAGLGEFCLELHSHKSQKRKFLDEVDVRLKKHGQYRRPKDIEVDIARYEELKTALKTHAEKINRLWKNTGKTIHDILMAATRYRNAISINPKRLYAEGYDGNNYDAAARRHNEDQVQAYRKVYQAVARQLDGKTVLQGHPWYGVRNSDLQIFDLDGVKESLEVWQDSLKALLSQRQFMADTFECEATVVAESVIDLQIIQTDLKRIPLLQGDELLDQLPILRGDMLEKTNSHLKLFDDIQALYADLAKTLSPEVLEDLSIVDQLQSGRRQFMQLVGSNVELAALRNAIRRLIGIQDQLEQLNEELHGVSLTLGEQAAKYLTISESGLTEFKTVIDIVTSLNPLYWKHRDELFDNEELDEIFPQLRRELEELLAQYDKIKGVFSLDMIPGELEIRQLATTLARGGILRWFKGDWRKARKQLLGYSANPQVKYPVMYEMLNGLAEFVGNRTKFEQNIVYKETVGAHFRGLDTDLSALEALRSWYKRVRQHYGIGFGRKVLIGEAILELKQKARDAVRTLAERDVKTKIEKIVDDFIGLREIFTPVGEIQAPDTLFIGEEGIIPRLLSQVNEAILACGLMINNDTITMAELAGRIEQVALLKQMVEKWQRADFAKELFQGRLAITPGVNAENSAGLSMLRKTLELAARINNELHNQALISYIHRKPQKETFLSLSKQTEMLTDAIEVEKTSSYNYATLVRLRDTAWRNSSGDNIDGLISRNQLALDNAEMLQNWLDYVRVRDQLDSMGMARLADLVEDSEIDITEAEDAYKAGIYDMLAREIFSENPELGRFSGRCQETLQDKFKEYDNKLKLLQCEQIAWKIDQTKIPTGNRTARVSELTERVLLEPGVWSFSSLGFCGNRDACNGSARCK
ncbi:MAG: DUF4011 domain-containing protein [Desulfobulbaceae bacterium]|nr:DUF4011 domain-containing protein [Desulfobulbaceae bacterium]